MDPLNSKRGATFCSSEILNTCHCLTPERVCPCARIHESTRIIELAISASQNEIFRLASGWRGDPSFENLANHRFGRRKRTSGVNKKMSKCLDECRATGVEYLAMGCVGMEQQRQTVYQFVCVVPYRAIHTGLELCLVTGEQDHHWEFPKTIVRAEVLHKDLALEAARTIAGLMGELHMDEPLHEFRSSRGSKPARSLLS